MFDVTTPDGAAYRESASFAPGDAVVTYPCEDMIVGCSICYDLRFPDLFQALAAKGAEMIALPAAFTQQTGKDHWEVLCRARAIETETYFCAAAQTGAHVAGAEKRLTYGHSLVADPWGHVIARASDGVGTVSTRIDVARVAKVRAQIPVARHKVGFEAASPAATPPGTGGDGGLVPRLSEVTRRPSLVDSADQSKPRCVTGGA